MTEYEPIDLVPESRHLINELTKVGLLAGQLVSRAAVENGNHDPITEMFDDVAQRITGTLLEFQVALKQHDRSDSRIAMEHANGVVDA